MLYRGQRYGASVGEWWTTDRDEALSFAMSAGGNRTYVVLVLHEDDEEWLKTFLLYPRAGHNKGDWYRIPIAELRTRWSGLTIDSGAVSI